MPAPPKGGLVSSDLAVRTAHRLTPDPSRVIARLFVPGEETPEGRSRARGVIARIMELDDSAVSALAEAVVADFRGRHRDLTRTFSEHVAVAAREVPGPRRLSAERRMVIAACFTQEYAPEGAALCNPSMCPHPDQTGLAEGQLRFVMTVRCIGEGHLSSIGFRTGVVGPGSSLEVDAVEPLLGIGATRPAAHQKRLILNALADLGDDTDSIHVALGGLADTFTTEELNDAVGRIHEHTLGRERVRRTLEHLHRVAAGTYEVEFSPETQISERLLWPRAPVESHGMEDARLVRFEHDGEVVHYATYTAYDGSRVGPHLLATEDFRRFHVTPMAGRAAQNKGMALFPRRIGGRYAALSRWDRESIALATSDDCRVWNDTATIYTSSRSWELIQVGNCGSPIETPAGWLVLTHGVGPMRSYALGAILLDLLDPSIVLATLIEPLLTPTAGERDGYVPNVVYSCGGLLHNETLTIPYGISDGAIGFAQVSLAQLLDRMLDRGRQPARSPNGQRPDAAPA